MVVSFIDSPFTTKVAYEAYRALPPDEALGALREAEAARASPPTNSGAAATGGLLSEVDFFDRESGAPLLRRNNGFLSKGGLPSELRARLDTWPTLAGATVPAEEVKKALVQGRHSPPTRHRKPRTLSLCLGMPHCSHA